MKNVILPVSALLVAMFSIQSGASLAKQLFPWVGAEGATSLRLFYATLILFAIWRPWNGKTGKLSRKNLFALFIYGMSLGSMNLFFYLALARLPLGLTVAIEFTGPLSIALLASRRALDFIWAILAIFGILLIVPVRATLPGISTPPLDPLGLFFALAAGICWAFYIVFGQKAGGSIHAGRATSLGMLIATVAIMPFGIARSGNKLLNLNLVPLALGVGVLSSAIPYSLEMTALKRLRTQTFGILMSLEPVIAALSGLIFLGEHLSASQWIAVTLIMAASLGSSIW